MSESRASTLRETLGFLAALPRRKIPAQERGWTADAYGAPCPDSSETV